MENKKNLINNPFEIPNIADWILGYFLLFIGFISPIIPFLILIISLVVYDTVYAIKSQVKAHGWGSIKSHKFFNIAPKIVFYGGGILVSYLIDLFIISENTIYNIPLLLSKVATVLFIINEIKSIDERRIKNGKMSIIVIIKSGLNSLKAIKKNLKDLKDE